MGALHYITCKYVVHEDNCQEMKNRLQAGGYSIRYDYTRFIAPSEMDAEWRDSRLRSMSAENYLEQQLLISIPSTIRLSFQQIETRLQYHSRVVRITEPLRSVNYASCKLEARLTFRTPSEEEMAPRVLDELLSSVQAVRGHTMTFTDLTLHSQHIEELDNTRTLVGELTINGWLPFPLPLAERITARAKGLPYNITIRTPWEFALR